MLWQFSQGINSRSFLRKSHNVSQEAHCNLFSDVQSAKVQVLPYSGYHLIEPTQASAGFPPAGSSNFGQRIPGVSRSSTFLFRRIHCFPLVTPGSFPVFAHAFPANVLINVDFPTFGIPATIARIGRFLIPRRRSRSLFPYRPPV